MYIFNASVRVQHGFVVTTQVRASSYQDALLLLKQQFGDTNIVCGPNQID